MQRRAHRRQVCQKFDRQDGLELHWLYNHPRPRGCTGDTCCTDGAQTRWGYAIRVWKCGRKAPAIAVPVEISGLVNPKPALSGNPGGVSPRSAKQRWKPNAEGCKSFKIDSVLRGTFWQCLTNSDSFKPKSRRMQPSTTNRRKKVEKCNQPHMNAGERGFVEREYLVYLRSYTAI